MSVWLYYKSHYKNDPPLKYLVDITKLDKSYVYADYVWYDEHGPRMPKPLSGVFLWCDIVKFEVMDED